MKPMVRIALATMALAASTALVAAVKPRVLAPVMGGLWDVSRAATGHEPVRMCLPNPVALAQYEHIGRRCERTLVSDNGRTLVYNYQCGPGDFGRSEVTALTPRTLRVDTQGLSGNAPFHYQIHARRVGDCVVR